MNKNEKLLHYWGDIFRIRTKSEARSLRKRANDRVKEREKQKKKVIREYIKLSKRCTASGDYYGRSNEITEN